MDRVLEYNYLLGYLSPPEDTIILPKVPCSQSQLKRDEEQAEELKQYEILKASQYRHDFVQERYDYYEYLCENLERFAKDNFLMAYLKYSEESYVMELSLSYKMLVYEAKRPTKYKEMLKEIFEKCETFLIAPYERNHMNYVKMKFLLHIADTVQVADHSKEMEEIMKRLKRGYSDS